MKDSVEAARSGKPSRRERRRAAGAVPPRNHQPGRTPPAGSTPRLLRRIAAMRHRHRAVLGRPACMVPGAGLVAPDAILGTMPLEVKPSLLGKNDMDRPQRQLVPVLALSATALAARHWPPRPRPSTTKGRSRARGSSRSGRAATGPTIPGLGERHLRFVIGRDDESYLVAPDRSAKRDKHGRFALEFKKAKQVGGPFPLYKIDASVHGNVNARSASGTVRHLLQEPARVRPTHPHGLRQRQGQLDRQTQVTRWHTKSVPPPMPSAT